MADESLEELFERTQAILDATVDAIITIDERGMIESFNKAAAHIFGYAPGEVIGQNIKMLMPNPYAERHDEYLATYLKTGHRKIIGINRETVAMRKGGQIFPAEISVSEVKLKERRVFTGIVRDATARVRAEEELRKHRHHLEELVEQRTSELSETNAKLRVEIAERERLQNELIRLSRIDGLTDIDNRRVFDETFDLEWRRARRDGAPLSLVMIDIDSFKAYNDCYGHQQGDACLRQVAAALQSVLKRASDRLARYGGEEFAAILPGCPAPEALTIAQHLRAAVAMLAIKHEKAIVGDRVTVSLGVATTIPNPLLERDALISAADKALYRAKHEGRNRVVVALAGD